MAFNPFEFGISKEDMNLAKSMSRSPRAASSNLEKAPTYVGKVPGIQNVENPLPSREPQGDQSHLARAGGNVTQFKKLKIRRPDEQRKKEIIRLPLPRRKTGGPGKGVTLSPNESVRLNREWERKAIQRARSTRIDEIEELPLPARVLRIGRNILVEVLSIFGIS